MVPVISVVGRPGCGKTTLLEKLIPELEGRGYRVGIIKHHVHRFDMDRPGKDTWRLKRAGARVVALSSPSGLGIIKDTPKDTPVEELLAYFGEVDLVFTEGYKRAALPKIEVYRRAVHPEPLPADSTWIAMVSEDHLEGKLPQFPPTDAAGLAEFLIDRFLAPAPRPAITLEVDGKPVALNRFAGSVLHQTVAALTGARKGGGRAKEITLRITDHDE